MSDGTTDTDPKPGEGDGAGGVSGGDSDPNPKEGGGSTEELLEKVGAVVEEHTGLKLEEVMAKREKAAAAEAAKAAGKTAQETYDPKIAALKTDLAKTQAAFKQVRRDTRDARIAALPEAAQETAKKLAELEDQAEEAKARIAMGNEALRIATAKEIALDLREKGIEGVTKEDFLEFDSPEAMEAKAAGLRAEHAERKLKEAIAGDDPEKGKKPPAASSKPSRKSGTTGAGGSKTGGGAGRSWEDQAKKGLSTENLAGALAAQREADDRGEK